MKKDIDREPEIINSKTSEECKKEREKWEQKHPILAFLKYKFYYPMSRFWSDFRFFIKYTIPEFFIRGKNGWAPSDTWSFFSYNAKVCRDALEYLKKNKCGIPQHVFPIVDEVRNHTDEEFRIAEKKWNEELDKMIFAFNCFVRDGEGNYELWIEDPKNPNKHLFSNNKSPFIDLQTKEEYEYMQEGLKLFIEHYSDLWD